MTEEEFAKIVNSTKKIVLSAISKHLRERFSFAIDDVAQETYFRAYKSLSKNSFRGDSLLSTWLYTIAKNESIRMNSKLEKEEKKIEKLKNQTKTEEIDSEVGLVEKYLTLLQKIPKKYSEILLHYHKGYSEKEISEKLNISKGTVKSRNSRGKVMIKKTIYGGRK